MNSHLTSILNLQPFRKELNCHEHREKLFTKMEYLWRNKKSCDLIIDANSTEFYCHRIFLTCLSKFFSCINKYNWNTNGNQKIFRLTLPFTDPENLHLILEYVYTGHITANGNNLISLIYSSDYFLFDTILESISKILNPFLTLENVIDFYLLANQINNQLIQSVTMRFIIRNVYSLHRFNELAILSLTVILEIIRDKRLIIRHESILYFGRYFKNSLEEIIESWINFDVDNRIEFKQMLVEFLDNQFFGISYDKVKLETYKYIEPISRAYFLNSIPFGQHPPSLVCPPYNFRCLGRNIRRTFIDNSPHKWFVKKLIIYIIPSWNNVKAIADIHVEYKHYWSNEIQTFKAVAVDYSSYIKKEVNLDDDERILKLEVYHGWMIYGMKFLSNKNRVFGVYGSCIGKMTEIDFHSEYSNSMYLHGFAFISIFSNDWHGINWLTVYGSMINKDLYYEDFHVAFEVNNRITYNKEDPHNTSFNDDCETIQTDPQDLLSDLVFPLPQTIEDLFYQWRRYMRMMKLSVIRQSSSNLSQPERNLMQYSLYSGISQNLSQSDIIENDTITDT